MGGMDTRGAPPTVRIGSPPWVHLSDGDNCVPAVVNKVHMNGVVGLVGFAGNGMLPFNAVAYNPRPHVKALIIVGRVGGDPSWHLQEDCPWQL